MSRNNFLRITELSDSREVLVERPHKFVSIFAYILISLFLIALIWSTFGRIDVYVRAHGEVRPNDTVSTIRSTFSGRMLEVNVEDGMIVERGDILFSIDVREHLDTLEILERQYRTISTEIENLILFRESIIQGENLFDRNDKNQIDYYFRFRQYIAGLETALEQAINTNFDIERLRADNLATAESAAIAQERADSEIYALQRLHDSIAQGVNMIHSRHAEQSMAFSRFDISNSRYAYAIATAKASLNRMEQLYEVGGVSRIEKDTARSELNLLIMERDSFIGDAQLIALQSISGLEWNILELDAAQRRANFLLEIPSGGFDEELLRERHMFDTLSSISDSVFSLQNNIYSLQNDISRLRLLIESARVAAPIDGVVSMFGEINIGDLIQAGTEIATILPNTKSEHRVMLLVSNADVADIEVGQTIYFRFLALPFADFGEMPGKVTRISADAHRVENGQSFFMVEAEMSRGSLFDRDGNESVIRVGMTCDARVITNNQRIIHWGKAHKAMLK